MCLAVPMKVIEVKNDTTGLVDFDGNRREVNISLLSDAKAGEYVIVHAGFAIEKLDEAEANERIAMFEKLALHSASADRDKSKQ